VGDRRVPLRTPMYGTATGPVRDEHSTPGSAHGSGGFCSVATLALVSRHVGGHAVSFPPSSPPGTPTDWETLAQLERPDGDVSDVQRRPVLRLRVAEVD